VCVCDMYMLVSAVYLDLLCYEGEESSKCHWFEFEQCNNLLNY
jgi:hypothetical protein